MCDKYLIALNSLVKIKKNSKRFLQQTSFVKETYVHIALALDSRVHAWCTPHWRCCHDSPDDSHWRTSSSHASRHQLLRCQIYRSPRSVGRGTEHLCKDTFVFTGRVSFLAHVNIDNYHENTSGRIKNVDLFVFCKHNKVTPVHQYTLQHRTIRLN